MSEAPVLDPADEWSAPRLHAGGTEAAPPQPAAPVAPGSGPPSRPSDDGFGRPTLVGRPAPGSPSAPSAPPPGPSSAPAPTVVVHSLDQTTVRAHLPADDTSDGRVVEVAPPARSGRGGRKGRGAPAPQGPVVVSGSQDRPAPALPPTTGPSAGPAAEPARPVPPGPRFSEPVVFSPADAAAVSLPAPREAASGAPSGALPAVRHPDEVAPRSAGPRAADLDRWGLQAEAIFAARAAQQAAAEAQPAAAAPSRPTSTGTKRFWLTALVLLLVGGLGLGSYELFFADDSGPTPSPEAVVTSYLNALARGDSSAALAEGTGAPAVTTFVTDDALQQQRKIAPLTAIGVTDTEDVGGETQVSAHYMLGSKTVNTQFVVVKKDGRWRLQNTTIQVGVTSLQTLPDLTLFGEAVSTTQVFVFPGPLVWGSLDSEDFAIIDAQPDQYATSPNGAHAASVSLFAKLTDTGRQKLDAAVAAYLAGCAASTRAVPDASAHCPQALEGQAYNGDATWSAPRTLSGETLSRGTDAGTTTTVAVTGKVTFTATYNLVVDPNGAKGPRHTKAQVFDVQGSVNFSANTPTFTPGQ